VKTASRFLTDLVLCVSVLVPLTSQGADPKETIRQARESYYSLKGQGLTEFRCQVDTDWDSIFKGVKTDAVGRGQVLPILKKTHFQLLVGPEGSSSVSHQTEVAPPNEKVAERVRSSVAGVEQILTGFLQTWSVFVISPPLPSIDSEYELQDLGEKFRLSYREGQADIVTSMSHDFAIDELKATTPEFEGSVRPKLSRNKEGFLLGGWEATYKAASGAPQQLAVKIEYGNVEGFRLPTTVEVVTSLDIHLTFADYQVKRRIPSATVEH